MDAKDIKRNASKSTLPSPSAAVERHMGNDKIYPDLEDVVHHSMPIALYRPSTLITLTIRLTGLRSRDGPFLGIAIGGSKSSSQFYSQITCLWSPWFRGNGGGQHVVPEYVYRGHCFQSG